jgi:hypothetical protein
VTKAVHWGRSALRFGWIISAVAWFASLGLALHTSLEAQWTLSLLLLSGVIFFAFHIASIYILQSGRPPSLRRRVMSVFTAVVSFAFLCILATIVITFAR